VREAHVSYLDQRLLPNGLGVRRPPIVLDKSVLIIAVAELIPIVRKRVRGDMMRTPESEH